ncbi:MAG: hypothetical protein EOS58_06320 [Mesorhizobium sp.]|uniref:hypothetical protein n=1 Tax=Mesorhizobium sp. M4A.F.Ca.ET.022.05.2.1 TaxID=2496653 RepID=UPI000FCA9914|nr:hypothetical protein [Mesorhizobium sp. M4A.F.Ca.ET.022.05.2.1]RVC75828.1 hypothetical protein EN745_26440 [Mesorhizobium sp. M4A.F.Ca.ET.022.05.2.1]RWD06620.1 MAG: hypothetical protein EOS58_06320 [Mesorhizobium sp.]
MVYDLAQRVTVPPLLKAEFAKARDTVEHARGWRRQQAARLLADDYGYRNGWRLPARPLAFCLGQLERRSNQTRRGEFGYPQEGLHKPIFYRADGRPAAIVAHPYHVDERGLQKLRQRFLLRFEIDETYPAWLGLDMKLLVITPDDGRIAALDAEAARLQEAPMRPRGARPSSACLGRADARAKRTSRARWPPGFGSIAPHDPERAAFLQLPGTAR